MNTNNVKILIVGTEDDQLLFDVDDNGQVVFRGAGAYYGTAWDDDPDIGAVTIDSPATLRSTLEENYSFTFFPCGLEEGQAESICDWLQRREPSTLRIERYVYPEIEESLANRARRPRSPEEHERDREWQRRERERDAWLNMLMGEPLIDEPDDAAYDCFGASDNGHVLDPGACKPVLRTIQLLHGTMGRCSDATGACAYERPASGGKYPRSVVDTLRRLVSEHGYAWPVLAEQLGTIVGSAS